MIIVFAGSIGRFPVGGHAWVDMQYLLGLQELGHEVFYLEECGAGSWVYHWETEELTTDLDYPTGYLRDCLEPIGFGKRWIYRAGEASVGMKRDDFLDVCARADLLLVRGISVDLWRPEYDRPRRRAFVDSDPGFTQFRVVQGRGAFAETVARCESVFTVGQGVGEPGNPIPMGGRRWHRMLPPVALSSWPPSEEPASHFTTILQWRSYAEVEHQGVRYGNKDKEFPKFFELPNRTSRPFRLALTGAPPERLEAHGWEVVPGWIASDTPERYRQFIRSSRAEFGVAKHGYVATKSGWFSDRSACYLASGRPVLLQDTGLPPWLATGRGIVTFRDLEEAVRGVESIEGDYQAHRAAARRLAQEHFDARHVLGRFLEQALD